MNGHKNDKVFHLLELLRTTCAEELESELVEFKGFRTKESVHNSRDLAEEISALANAKGGLIILGVQDNEKEYRHDWSSQLTGIEKLDALETQERIQGKLTPRIPIEVSNVTFDEKNFVAISVPHRSDYLVGTTSGKYCIREGRSSRPMTPGEVESAVRAFTTYDWSAEPVDLDVLPSMDDSSVQEAIDRFSVDRDLPEKPDTLSFLEAIGATRNGVLLKGGLVFLGDSETIRAQLGNFEYRFSWKTSAGKLIQNDVWSSNVWQAVQRMRTHFNDCNSSHEFTYKEKTFEVPLLDKVAFHEAFLNALVHRDYTAEGMVSVTFSGSAITISSPGKFYGGITPENIAVHEPRHRNKALARMLMTYQLVDRAGMGVLRMGLGSMKYGRAFPEFREGQDSVDVVMEAEYLRVAVTVISLDNEDKYGITELLILNCVFETGFVPVTELLKQLERLVDNPWESVRKAIEAIDAVELCGTNEGTYIRVRRQWSDFMEVTRALRISASSKKHVDLFSYLMKHGTAANADIRAVLKHKHTSQTSTFLKNAKYVKRTGSGPSARWFLT